MEETVFTIKIGTTSENGEHRFFLTTSERGISHTTYFTTIERLQQRLTDVASYAVESLHV